MLEIEISSPTSLSNKPLKKKRNLPGMPDPDAQVIALSPESLIATNRFVCEVCGKGFQRDQNLQLHRRGHNLPWKLKQRTTEEAMRKRVYVCPEATCVHHHPSRALGDLTGIKKHFSRKHGEKKFECPRCSKKYAVQSDWKAHVKACGTREYTCDCCATLFSRRDSFITHTSFCHASAMESVQSEPTGDSKAQIVAPLVTPSIQSSATELLENQNACLEPLPTPQGPATLVVSTITTTTTRSSTTGGAGGGALSTVLNSSTSEHSQSSSHHDPAAVAPYPNPLCPLSGSGRAAIDPMYLSLSSHPSSFYEPPSSQNPHQPLYLSRPQPALSATALLQKAAQMGSTSSKPSFLHGLGLALPYSSSSQCDHSRTSWNTNSGTTENNSLVAFELGLGLPSGGSSNLNELMMCPSELFGGRPTTLDFLGLGMGVGESSSSEGLSGFLSSIGRDVNLASGMSWDGSCDRKPSGV